MNISLVVIGKLKERYWVDACAEYLKRMKPYAHLDIKEIPDIDPARAGGVSSAVTKEGEAILAALPTRAYVIAMAIEGRQRSSVQFSQHIDELQVRGISDLCFIIGGSDGLSAAVMNRADESFSFGKITLPHNIVRVVLLEQLYRAFKISRGEPYHK